MRVVLLASGSRGNATLFQSTAAVRPPTRVLVDAGLSRRELRRRLHAVGDGDHLDAIVITHAHRDHVGDCERLAARYEVPLYMSESTARWTAARDVQIFSPREPFRIGGLDFVPTPLPHDAAQVAFTVSDGMHRVGLCTDLGEVPAALPERLAGCDILLIESNHDLSLLRDGPYPDFMKRRIASARGHLSNAQCAELLRHLAPTLDRVVLMHLSQTNNRPTLALQSALEAVAGRGVDLSVAEQEHPLVLVPRTRTVAPRPRVLHKNVAQLAFAF